MSHGDYNMKNINGQGSISYEKDRNTYRAAIVDINGKRVRKRFATKHEAEDWLTVIRAEFINNTYLAKTDYTLGEWLIEFLSTYMKPTVKPTTFNTYKNSSNHFDAIAGTNISDLSPLTLQKFFNSHFEDMPTAKFNAYAVLNAAMKKAVKLGIIKNNPCDNVDIIRPEAKEITIFTKEEFTQLMEFVKNNGHYKRYYLMLLTTALTGMRLGEVCALKWDCVFPDHIKVAATLSNLSGKQHIGKPKKKTSERDITIPKFLYDLLKDSPHTCDFVFPTRTGRGIMPTNFDSVTWPHLMKASSIPFRTFHSLRHTHASLLLANGVSIAEISKRLGHKKSPQH